MHPLTAAILQYMLVGDFGEAVNIKGLLIGALGGCPSNMLDRKIWILKGVFSSSPSCSSHCMF